MESQAELRCASTGSSGNAYALVIDNEILLLDAGARIADIKKMCDWKISSIAGALITHKHRDHAASVDALENMGIVTVKPYCRHESKQIKLGSFHIKSFELTTLDGSWTHTDANGDPCPIYGFLIEHSKLGKLLYVTDTELIKWRFKGLNHILLGVNYDASKLDYSEVKSVHVAKGHMSVQTACSFLNANNNKGLQNIIICHLSADNAQADEFVKVIQENAPQAAVRAIKKGEKIELESDCPF